MISIVVPFYNEEKRMHEYFDPFFERIRQQLDDFELIAVNDGSTDQTVALLRERAAKEPRLIIAGYEKNQGRGAAVRAGVLQARGELVWETDADGSYDVSQCKAFAEYLEAHPDCDVVIASRENKHSHAVVNQPPLRVLAGKVFHALFRLVTGGSFSDVMAGCKMYRRDAAKVIFAHQYDNRYLGAAETVYAAGKLGYTVHELPVTWTDVSGAHIKFITDTIRTLKGLTGIGIRTLEGKYMRSSNQS
ncbi:MAG: glycosyltransferase [Candidatus Paceibacterota bacterium]|jgi:dolichyl-phosphate beta-glucosyltransferase